MTELHWLPTLPDWRQRLRALPVNPATAWDNAVALANAQAILGAQAAPTPAKAVPEPPAHVGGRVQGTDRGEI